MPKSGTHKKRAVAGPEKGDFIPSPDELDADAEVAPGNSGDTIAIQPTL